MTLSDMCDNLSNLVLEVKESKKTLKDFETKVQNYKNLLLKSRRETYLGQNQYKYVKETFDTHVERLSKELHEVLGY